MAKENKLKKEVVEDFIRWVLFLIAQDKIGGKKQKEKAAEREYALKVLCEKADIEDVLERIQTRSLL